MMLLASVLFPLDSQSISQSHYSLFLHYFALEQEKQFTIFPKKKKKIQNTKLLWLSPSQGGSLFSRERDLTADGLQKSCLL